MVPTAWHLAPSWDGVPAAPRLCPAAPWGPRRTWESQELLDLFVFLFLEALTSGGDFLLRGQQQTGSSFAWGFPLWGEWVGET